MIHISILVLNEAIINSIDAPKQLFSKVNEVIMENGGQPLFDVNLVGITKETSINSGAYKVQCDFILNEIVKTDLVIIPMVCNGFKKAIEANRGFTPWIIDQYKNNTEIACLCTGSFMLASTGLLNGKNCSVHWATTNEFTAMFPAVKVVNDKIITYDQGVYTSGGYYSYLNLILCLIEKYAGRAMAILFSKMFEIDFDRKSQSSFMIFTGQKDHEDEPIKKAQEFIENNYQGKITIDQLIKMLALSRRNFERRFKKATSNTIIEYIQRVKIEAAKKGLEAGRKPVTELMYEVGYSDVKAFRSIFKKLTGLSPIEYRNKYQNN